MYSIKINKSLINKNLICPIDSNASCNTQLLTNRDEESLAFNRFLNPFESIEEDINDLRSFESDPFQLFVSHNSESVDNGYLLNTLGKDNILQDDFSPLERIDDCKEEDIHYSNLFQCFSIIDKANSSKDCSNKLQFQENDNMCNLFLEASPNNYKHVISEAHIEENVYKFDMCQQEEI